MNQSVFNQIHIDDTHTSHTGRLPSLSLPPSISTICTRNALRLLHRERDIVESGEKTYAYLRNPHTDALIVAVDTKTKPSINTLEPQRATALFPSATTPRKTADRCHMRQLPCVP
mmetsp:Transcript_31116/g.77097  ORF Transcript_31116/g.77097 Transcript_31116/m.77097 type:complete len:115 (-) Transcript_31116:509-853(-)